MSVHDVHATRDFCERGGRATGAIDPGSTERLIGIMAPSAPGPAVLDWQVVGRMGRDGRHRIDIEVRGDLHLRCQRCLEAMDWRVDTRRTVVFVPPGALGAVEDEAEDEDLVPFETTFCPVERAVDEVILALPYAPMHPDGQCAMPDTGAREAVLVKQH
jgi:uncharacterized protein